MIDDADSSPDVWGEVDRKARKSHKCQCCGREIVAGETYKLFSGLYEGRWENFKICSHCLQITDWLERNCGGWLMDSFSIWLDFREHRDCFTHPTQRRALRGMRREWRYSNSDRLMPVQDIVDLPVGVA